MPHRASAPVPAAPAVLCARCRGIYGGIALGIAVLAAARHRRLFPTGVNATTPGRKTLLFTGAAMAADVLLEHEHAGAYPGWALLRLATGAAFGLALGAALFKRAAPPRGDPGSAEEARRVLVLVLV